MISLGSRFEEGLEERVLIGHRVTSGSRKEAVAWYLRSFWPAEIGRKRSIKGKSTARRSLL